MTAESAAGPQPGIADAAAGGDPVADHTSADHRVADVAVVVPSIGVNDLLVRCLGECARLFPGVELVAVVDDDEGAARLEGMARVILSRDPSIAAKRNLGVASTSSRYLAFIDSDAYPAPGWLCNAVRLLDGDAALAAAGGPNVSPPDQPAWEAAVGLAHRSVLVDGWWRFRKDRFARARDVSVLPSCNLIVRRSDYEALGGMNEDLFTAEDTDLCARLGRSGRRIRFSPEVVVFHKDRGLWAFAIQRYTFGVAIVPLVRRGQPPDVWYLLVSAALVVFVTYLLSAPVGLVSKGWARWWRRVGGVYAMTLFAEAVRLSGRPRQVPRVLTALVVGNIGPGLGALMEVLGLSPRLQGRYRNDQREGRARRWVSPS